MLRRGQTQQGQGMEDGKRDFVFSPLEPKSMSVNVKLQAESPA